MDNKLNNDDYRQNSFGELIETGVKLKQKSKSFITAQFSNLATIALIVIAYLMFFTDGKLTPVALLKEISLLVIALLFFNNAAFNNMIESGQKAAQCTKDYKVSIENYKK